MLLVASIVLMIFYFFLKLRILNRLEIQAGEGALDEAWIRWALKTFSLRAPVRIGLGRRPRIPDPREEE